jgi:hypothetical protein
MNSIDRRAYEGDIVSRLRHWRGLHLAQCGELFEEAAAEIERLRNGAAEGCETVSLTDEEREAIEVAAAAYADDHGERFAATLRLLLARLA